MNFEKSIKKNTRGKKIKDLAMSPFRHWIEECVCEFWCKSSKK
jgi:hypothetical protein